MPDFAFLEGGRLFVKLGDDDPREVESPFAESVIKRAASIAKRNEWKTQGRGARFMMGLEGLPQELLEPKLSVAPIRFTGLSRGRHPAELMYSLSTGVVSGLFAFAGGEEERLLHGNDWDVSEPACEPDGERLACVARGKDGQAHIAVLAPGRRLEQVTAGDAVDAAPCWIPGANRIVFESRALGYSRNGAVVELAPATIEQLDLDAGEVTPLVQTPNANATSPRVTADGTLYYLRQSVRRRAPVSILNVLLDVLLFPLRLLFALLQYLNFFSLNYTGKPLIRAHDARAKQADVKRAAQLGNLVSAAGDARDDDEDPKVPDDWCLIARRPNGEEQVVARRVVCFDVYRNGSVVYSDGRTATHRASDGAETKLGRFPDVGEVLALDRD